MLERQLSDDSGNLYKPEGDGARLETFVKDHMIKKSNSGDADYSDVASFISALNGDRADAAAWRAALEKTFDVTGFLRYLAVNQAMQNWDSYGFMSHNYFLYAAPTRSGRLTWIPWDLTLALMPMTLNNVDTGSVLLGEITARWPLIRHVLDDAVYLKRYKDELRAVLSGPLALGKVNARIDAYHSLLKPYVVGADGEVKPYTSLASQGEFEQSLTTGTNALKPHLSARHLAVNKALGL